MDTETALISIGLVSDLQGVKYLFTAHYGYSDDYEVAVMNWEK